MKTKLLNMKKNPMENSKESMSYDELIFLI